jgi:hypothetical protein
MREMIGLEQTGKPVVASPRFEFGASTAASLLSRFSNEKAEIRLVIDGDAGEYGVGASHLYGGLRRFAMLEPQGPGQHPSEPDDDILRILNERADDHQFLVTATDPAGETREGLERLKIIRY